MSGQWPDSHGRRRTPEVAGAHHPRRLAARAPRPDRGGARRRAPAGTAARPLPHAFARRRGKKVALMAAARELLELSWTLLSRGGGVQGSGLAKGEPPQMRWGRRATPANKTRPPRCRTGYRCARPRGGARMEAWLDRSRRAVEREWEVLRCPSERREARTGASLDCRVLFMEAHRQNARGSAARRR
jgi:hypothetical protein